jgi:hypothetical protein
MFVIRLVKAPPRQRCVMSDDEGNMALVLLQCNIQHRGGITMPRAEPAATMSGHGRMAGLHVKATLTYASRNA